MKLSKKRIELLFASMAEYGKWMDALNADPAFHASRAKTIETGVVQFVRSNLVRELTL
jgi:hypothetical protein